MQTFSTLQFLIFAGLIGLVVGSFLSMLTWRLPRAMLLSGEEQLKHISVGGSKCPQCEQPIPWYRLIPLFSWIFAKGRCHHCQAKISMRYPLIETATAMLTLGCAWQFGQSLEMLAAVVFSWLLIAIFVIDYEHQLILDNLSLPLLWLGLLVNTNSLFATPVAAIWGAAIGYIILWLVFHLFKLTTGKEGMGYGDFKLLAALGAWFGAVALPQIILIAALSSLLISLIGIAFKKRDKNAPIAFGPFLAIGGWASLFLGPQII